MGPIARIERLPFETQGFSGARHERLRVTLRSGESVSLVLKRVRPAVDWTSYRTGDRDGREALLLAEPTLAGIWSAFHSPFRAYAIENGEVGLLMDDLSFYLLPDGVEPIAEKTEDAILRALASLHARYWASDALRLSFLTPFATRLGILNLQAADEEARRPTPYALFATIRRGWETALNHLSPEVRDLLTDSPDEIARRYADLPVTLLHGDPKFGNFALVSHNRVAAFDWAVVGVGPPAMDLGHYLAINAARLSRSKEDAMARYRGFLEVGLGEPLGSRAWERMIAAAIVCGSAVLLWSKGLALESGSPEAEMEWKWWAGHLTRIARELR